MSKKFIFLFFSSDKMQILCLLNGTNKRFIVFSRNSSKNLNRTKTDTGGQI